MDFMIPPEQNEDPADDWKKDKTGKKPDDDISKLSPIDYTFSCKMDPKPHTFNDPPIPDVYKKYAFGHGISFELADQIAMRFTELGFDPETIHDPTIFGMLFLTRENCLMVTRRLSQVDQTYYVTGHRFLERKKK